MRAKRFIPPKPRKKGGWGGLVILVAAIILFRSLLWEPFRIPSSSMEPTLLPGDYVLVAKYAYGYSRHSFPFSLPPTEGKYLAELPRRGDIVVFRRQRRGKYGFYIKRVIGLPGDTVETTSGGIAINGNKIPLKTTADAAFLEELPGEEGRHSIYAGRPIVGRYPRGVYKVPDGHLFVMGDNRNNSVDSRFAEVGFIPEENVVGRAEVIAFSFADNPPIWQVWRLPFSFRGDRFAEVLH